MTEETFRLLLHVTMAVQRESVRKREGERRKERKERWDGESE